MGVDMETVAIYTEERIRIYGITQRGPQALLTFQFDKAEFQFFSRLFEKIRSFFPTFEQFSIIPLTEHLFSAHLLLSEQIFVTGSEEACKLFEIETGKKLKIISPVDTLFLHGPHFHDRYGIADAIFSAIKEKGIETLACRCSGTSMYITMRPEQTQACFQLIKDTFLIPSSS